MDVKLRVQRAFIFDDKDNRYFDASRRPVCGEFAAQPPSYESRYHDQLDNAYTHPVLADPLRARFCAKLAKITPGNLDHIYLVSGGSEALKRPSKWLTSPDLSGIVISIRRASEIYHGMTLATLGASGSPGSHRPFMPMILSGHIRQYSISISQRELVGRNRIAC